MTAPAPATADARPPGAGQRLRQDGPAGARHRPARGRRRDRLHRLHRAAHRRRRGAGDQRRGAHRVPRVPGRPGQDAAPAGARRAARRHPRPTTSTSWTTLGIAPFDLLVVNLYPFTADGRLRRRRPTSASSRSTSAAPRWCGRPRRTTTASPSSSTRRATPGCSSRCGRRLRRWPTAGAGRRGVPAHRDLRHRRRLLDGQRAAPTASRDGSRPFPALGRRDVAAAGRPALRREPAPGRRAVRRPGDRRPRRRGAAARQGDVVQQLRRRRRRLAGRARPRRRAVRGDHQAREPVRHRASAATSPRRTAGPRLRPDVAPSAA